MTVIQDHVAQNIPSCREVVTRACFKQKWMWVRFRLVSSPEESLWAGGGGGQCGQSSLKAPFAYSTVRSSQGREQGREEGRHVPAAPLEPR